MEKLKPRAGRPPLIDDEKLIAEKIRKAQARNADRAARKIDDLWKVYLDLALPDEKKKVSAGTQLTATKEVFKMLAEFEAKATEEEVVEDAKPSEDNTIKVNFG